MVSWKVPSVLLPGADLAAADDYALDEVDEYPAVCEWCGLELDEDALESSMDVCSECIEAWDQHKRDG